ncbi:unnamed protein product [Phaedon cochleariae]|uniref:10 kDa heat shock protein, mitochondrial n=1 Tax=Phaedon cochleariae TaxID=80249 RepID=A0A9P0DJY2_PHACE|nr:unnamed protein product [Phaedon cochleariae]
MSAATKAVPKFKRVIPLLNRVLIKKSEPATETKGGIVLPDNTKAKLQKGTVVAVGPGGRTEQGQHIPMSVRAGDEVLLADYGGTKVELEGNEVYFLYRESEILAKLYD